MKSIDIIFAVITAELCNHMIFLKYIEKMNSLTRIHVKFMLAI